jgi:predicted alpha/beta-fold hydrolase
MSRRSKKAKTEKIAEFDHELGIKIHNEPHLEDFYRAEYAEKVAKIK